MKINRRPRELIALGMMLTGAVGLKIAAYGSMIHYANAFLVLVGVIVFWWL